MATFKRILNLENYIFTFFILFVFYGAINSPYSLVKILWEKPKHLLVLLPLLIILLLIIYKNKKFLYTKIQALWHLIKTHDRVVIIGSLISLFLLQLLLCRLAGMFLTTFIVLPLKIRIIQKSYFL